MKKILSALVILIVLMVAGCSQAISSSDIRVGGLKGPTTMGMVKLLDSYDFTMAGTADELTPKFLKGELDIITVPANLGAVLYNSSEGAVQMAAINVLGVLYIVENGENTIQSVEDLKGRTICATGKGSTPEAVLKYILSAHGIDAEEDLTIEWKSETSEALASLASGETTIAMLPEPFVESAKGQIEGLEVVLDLNEEWEKLGNGSIVTAAVLVRTQFAKEHPEAVKKFISDYRESEEFVNSNIEEAAGLIEECGITKAEVAQKALPACNIVCITGDEMKQMAGFYFQVLADENIKMIGGSIPGEAFYWTE